MPTAKMKAAPFTYTCNALKLLLVVALLLHNGNLHETYHVKPSPDSSCTYYHCDMLSGYLEHSEVFQTPGGNITVVFLPGIHHVSKSLTITGLNKLFLSGKDSHIQCTAQAYFKFTDMNVLEINNLVFSYCGGLNRASLTAQFRVLVILAQDIYQLFITNSHFTENNYTSAISTNRIKEMVITNCSFDRNKALYSNGGAISAFETEKLKIRKCNFTNNHYRGAVFVTGSFNVIVSDSRFVNNSANIPDCVSEDCNYNGGAISIFGFIEEIYLTTVSLDGNNLFENNFALMSGGGLYVQQSILNISGETIFRHNTAQFRGGGLAVREGLSVTITNSTFINNHGNNIGGAVSISYVLYITLTSCIFLQNRVSSQGANVLANGGGGIAIIGLKRGQCIFRYPANTTMVIIKGLLLFKNNLAEGSGGGIFAQSVAFNLSANSCVFEGNTAIARGGAITIQAADKVRIEGCIFLFNRCQWEAGALSLLQVESVTFFDAQFENNHADKDGGALLIDQRYHTILVF